MGLRLVERAPSGAEQVAADLANTITPTSKIVDRIERQSTIVGLAATGLYQELVKLHPANPLRRYACILANATTDLRADLGDLINELRRP